MKKLVVGLVTGALLFGGMAAYSQDVREWLGHMVMRQRNPEIRFDGTLSFKNRAGTTTLFQLGQSGNATKLVNYRTTLNPTAIAATAAHVHGSTETQDFTVTGLAVSDVVFINGPAPTALCPAVFAKIPGTNTLSITFAKLTTALCTPATGVYNIFAVAS